MEAQQLRCRGAFYIDDAMKAVEWERAKGHLRALVALQGSYGGRGISDSSAFKRLGDKVAAFIKDVENNGLDE